MTSIEGYLAREKCLTLKRYIVSRYVGFATNFRKFRRMLKQVFPFKNEEESRKMKMKRLKNAKDEF